MFDLYTKYIHASESLQTIGAVSAGIIKKTHHVWTETKLIAELNWWKDICGDNIKAPSSTSKDEQEKKLGIRLQVIRANKTKPYPEEEKLWTEMGISLEKTKHNWTETKIIAELNWWKDICGDNIKAPSSISKDERERKLGNRLLGIRHGAKLYPAEEKLWTDMGISLKTTQHKWTEPEIITELNWWKAKCGDNIKAPSLISKDEREKRLGTRLNRIRQRVKPYPAEEKLWTDMGISLESTSHHLTETEIITELNWWKDICGDSIKAPSSISKDERERKLGNRLLGIRHGAKLYPEEEKLWTDMGISLESTSHHLTETEIITELNWWKDICGDNLKAPSSKSKDEREKRLGRRLHTIRQGTKPYPVEEKLWTDMGISLSPRKQSQGRHLDIHKYSGEKLLPISQKPRRTIDYASPISVGAAVLDGRFAKDATNISNPRGLDTDITPKHDKTRLAGNFTLQEAVETTVYADVHDLLRCIASVTNFDQAPARRKTTNDPEIKNAVPKLYKITDAENFVLELSEKIGAEDSVRLLSAYDALNADPENLPKARELVSILKDLKIKYNKDLQAAYCLVFEINCGDIINALKAIPLNNANQKMLAETTNSLALIYTGAFKDKDLYKSLSERYAYQFNIPPFEKLIRTVRLNLKKLLPDWHAEMTAEAESLAGH
ncbi:MAG: hypothetical protein LBK68_05955 [Candidatus Margulisbacteria bacterium]|jgi:hypothetical protein|nr:hypothetical protein [Candidatus Margulisiibacteriota bacterium]